MKYAWFHFFQFILAFNQAGLSLDKTDKGKCIMSQQLKALVLSY